VSAIALCRPRQAPRRTVCSPTRTTMLHDSRTGMRGLGGARVRWTLKQLAEAQAGCRTEEERNAHVVKW
jgi:hypothetical protein